MTAPTVDNSFVGKMHLSSVSVQHQTVWSVVTPGKCLCPVEKCHISVLLHTSFIILTMAVTSGICMSSFLLLRIATQGFCCCLFVCVCVCACVRACVRARVCVCV